jgi:hypothetical protein
MTIRPSHLSTSPDCPPPEDLYAWLPTQHPTLVPSPFLSPEESFLPIPESPSSRVTPLANLEESSMPANAMLSVPLNPQDNQQGKVV